MTAIGSQAIPSVYSAIGMDKALEADTKLQVIQVSSDTATDNEAVKAQIAAYHTDSVEPGMQKKQWTAEFTKDIENNEKIVDSLVAKGVKPDPAKLADVADKVKVAPTEFNNLVAATTVSGLAMGQSDPANTKVENCLGDFCGKADVGAANVNQMAYLMARIVDSSQQTERDQALTALEESLKIQEDSLKQLEAQDESTESADGKVMLDGKMVNVAKLEEQSKMPGEKGAAAQEKLSRIESTKSTNSTAIDSTKESIAAIKDAIAAQQSTKNPMMDELIAMMVNKTNSISDQMDGMQDANKVAATGDSSAMSGQDTASNSQSS